MCVGVKIMKLITCHFPEAYLDAIEELVRSKIFPNRSEAIRVAVRDMLNAEITQRMVKDQQNN